MYSKFQQAWLTAGLDTLKLGAEASAVVGLRVARMAAGGDAGLHEAGLMVTEKVGAALELQAMLVQQSMRLTPLAGTQKAIRHYRRKVAANKRRLSR